MLKRVTNIAAMILATGIIILSGCSKDDSLQPNTALNVNTEGYSNINTSFLNQQISNLPKESLGQDETESILFMREEEKLARDANILFYQKWGHQVFDNISTAEQTHMDAILLLITKYNLADPVGTNPAGTFSNPTLQNLYSVFSSQGNISLVEALKAGTAIEEIDIRDFNTLLTDNDVNNADILLVYNNLLKASRNHLRSFVKVLNNLGVTYSPGYLSAEEYYNIINSPMETGQ